MRKIILSESRKKYNKKTEKGGTMIKGLTEEEKYKVLRPIIGECERDEFEMPIIRKTEMDAIDWEKLKIIGLQNASTKTADKNTLVTMFNYDKQLLRLWNDPLKKVGLFQGFAAIATPDYSISSQMDTIELSHNVYMSRWLGVTWQNYNNTVLPTIGWDEPSSYDISFSGVEKNSVVIVSTLGCQGRPDVFLEGFNEMKRRIEPPLIIVVGDMIDGMTGSFINFKYEDCFSPTAKYDQMQLEGVSRIFTVV